MKKSILIFAASLAFVAAGCKKTEPTSDDSSAKTAEEIIANTDDFVEYSDFSTTVTIVYNGASATVTNPAAGAGVTISNNDGQVTVTSTIKGVEYAVSGNGSGQLKIYSSYKFKTTLNNLTLTNTSGPAINIQSGKRNFLVLSGTNTITGRGNDTATDAEDEKGTVFSEGQVIVSGDGALNIASSYKHAFASDDYIRIREGAVTLTASGSNCKDGINTNDGFIMDGGTLTVNSTDEGICAGDDDHTGYTYIQGGVINITTTGGTAKGIKAYGDIWIQGGIITVNTPGYESKDSGSEGIESKATLTISGGHITVNSYDDAINSAGNLYIKGGYVYAHSTNNDGIDANGNCYIQGGVVYAIGASSPECAVDANTEQGYKLYVEGGMLVAISSLESGASMTQACYQTGSFKSGTWYALYNGGALALAFKTSTSGSNIIVSTSGTPTLTSGVTVSGGTEYFNGAVYVGGNVSGGSEASLSAYTGGAGGGGGKPGGNNGNPPEKP